MTQFSHAGQLLAACLRNLGARRAFGVPGESYLALLDALHDTPGELDFTLCRNEGGAAFMAAAWGKLTGAPGIAMVTRGPGATNASIGVHTAMQDSSPMILLVGQIATGDRDREAFQELNYRAVFGSMAKWVTECDRAERIPEIMQRAWSTALSGRPGPVVVALPEDMLSGPATAAPCETPRIARAAPGAGDIAEAAERLAGARRPLVIAGGGGWSDDGRLSLRRFLTRQAVPALSAFRYHDLVDNHLPEYAGDAGVGMPPAVRRLISQSDLILALNIRFGEMVMDDYSIFPPPKMAPVLIHSHGSDRELGKIYTADLPIHAAPDPMAAALAELPPLGDWRGWRDEARAAYEEGQKVPAQPGPVDMGAVIAHLQGALSDDAIITNGAGNFAIWPNKHFRFGAGQRLLAPQSGAMGFGLPAAIAAALAAPRRQVLCFAGDGDFQMNCQELGTAAQAGARPIVLVLNNGTYGTIRMHQERNYPDRVSGTTLVNPDFAALARAYGFAGEKVTRTADFAPAFARAQERAQAADGSGSVLELAIGAEALTPKQTLSQIREQGRGRKPG